MDLNLFENREETYREYSLHRDLHKRYLKVYAGDGNYLFTKDGRKVFDAACGASVAILGYNNKRVNRAIIRQIETGLCYVPTAMWMTDVVEDLCKCLLEGTDGKMARVFLAGSGSEATDTAIKCSRQYFVEKEGKGTPRVNYIARDRSYHGNTLGALSLSGFLSRKEPYKDILMKNFHHVSSCYPYRQQEVGESDADFVVKKAAELEAKFQELGPETVAAFMMEPVVGAALGCVPSVPGYLKAMRDVCHKHGALFILDEVMCGMGKTGTLHAWQGENVAPDIQTVAKALGAGYAPISGMLVSEKILKALEKGSGEFVHGFTYEAMPIQAAPTLEVQRIIQEENLLKNVTEQGKYLEERLRFKLGDHPNVGQIRGKGLFWGLEFVQDRTSKEPFDPELRVAQKIFDLATSSPYNMTVYPSTGCVDGKRGDIIIIAPSYKVTNEDVDHIVWVITSVVGTVFLKIQPKG